MAHRFENQVASVYFLSDVKKKKICSIEMTTLIKRLEFATNLMEVRLIAKS